MTLTEMPVTYAGDGFPWGLLIIGGILYLLWRNGMFGGPGRQDHGQHFGGGYGPGYGPPPGGDAGVSAQRALFDEWHRQAHEAASARPQTPVTPPAPAAPAAPERGQDEPAP